MSTVISFICVGMFLLCILVMLASNMWMIVMAFQESVVWGLVYLFLPFGALAFMLTRWDRTWRPFVLNLNALIGAIFFLLAPAFFVKRVDPTEVGSTMVSFFELLIT